MLSKYVSTILVANTFSQLGHHRIPTGHSGYQCKVYSVEYRPKISSVFFHYFLASDGGNTLEWLKFVIEKCKKKWRGYKTAELHALFMKYGWFSLFMNLV